jgi:Rps23 Pro-64 3,4-dihydroxylase Tpa1-like proline 4-hydroxylase
MIPREVVDSLTHTLLHDERVLDSREQELLTNLLRHANSSNGDPAREVIVRAVGETIAQRAYQMLGESVVRQLLDSSAIAGAKSNTAAAAPTGAVRGEAQHSPPLPPAPAPGPPGPKSYAGAVRGEAQHSPPLPPAPAPGPPGPKSYAGAVRGEAQHSPPLPPAPAPGPPGPRGAGENGNKISQLEKTALAVVEEADLLPAQCVVFDEFLAPAEMNELLRYGLQHEADFEVSEVVAPGLGGTVDFDNRRSRVLMDLDKHEDVLVNRLRACLPRVFARLNHAPFTASRVEAQITASNDGDFFHWHSDNGQTETAGRQLTFVYFFHREPKRFRGGELRIYDSRMENGAYTPSENYLTIVPRQNQMVLFPSSLAHEITPVECPSRAFADSRFTVNGWLHR